MLETSSDVCDKVISYPKQQPLVSNNQFQCAPDIILVPLSTSTKYDNHIFLNNLIIKLFIGVPEVIHRIFVIGALGRCGKGAVEMAHKLGVPKYVNMI